MEIDMKTPVELSAELYENVRIFQKEMVNDKRAAVIGLADFKEAWLDELFRVVEPWEKRIEELKTKRPFRSAVVEKKFTNSFEAAFRTLAVIDLECRGLRPNTAEKLVASLLK